MKEKKRKRIGRFVAGCSMIYRNKLQGTGIDRTTKRKNAKMRMAVSK
jgi:hypothetical protein